MSFVLDALRKSEHERQRLTGQTSSMLYPVLVDDDRAFRLWMAVIAGAVFAMVLLLSLWWLWPHTPQEPDELSEPVARNTASPPPTHQTQAPPVQNVKPAVPQAEAPSPASAPKKPVAATARKPVAPVKRATPVKSAAKSSPPPAATPKPPVVASDDPLKDLPPLEISGYLHDEQTGNLAIINDKLVHEGEEVAPGLVLEEIRGDSALFNYKGHKFRR